MKTSIRQFTLLLAIACSLASGHSQNLVQNGSFEELGATMPFPPLSNIHRYLTAWTIDGFGLYFGGIDIILDSDAEGHKWVAADGHTSLSLNWGDRGAVSQSVATTAGMAYNLTFSMAAEVYGGPALRTMNVLWNGSVVGTPTFAYAGQTWDNMGWTEFSYTVVGTGNDVLRFESTTGGAYGPALDKVALIVPEPGLASVIGVGLLVLAFSRK